MPPLPRKNVDTMIFISRYLHDIIEHKFVWGEWGGKRKDSEFNVLSQEVPKVHVVHIVFVQDCTFYSHGLIGDRKIFKIYIPKAQL